MQRSGLSAEGGRLWVDSAGLGPSQVARLTLLPDRPLLLPLLNPLCLLNPSCLLNPAGLLLPGVPGCMQVRAGRSSASGFGQGQAG